MGKEQGDVASNSWNVCKFSDFSSDTHPQAPHGWQRYIYVRALDFFRNFKMALPPVKVLLGNKNRRFRNALPVLRLYLCIFRAVPQQPCARKDWGDLRGER